MKSVVNSALGCMATAMLSFSPALAQSIDQSLPRDGGVQEVRYAPQLVPVGTPVRLMNLVEINSRSAFIGQKFKLRVQDPVLVDAKTVIPVGTLAWGEVVAFQGNGAVGKAGKIGVKILYLDLPEGRLPLNGNSSQEGNGNATGVAVAVISFGLLGLFTAGDSARLKGGDQIVATVGASPNVNEMPAH
jgi:hypothetical protein